MKKQFYLIMGAALAGFLTAPAYANHGLPQGKLLGSFNMVGHPQNVDVLPDGAEDSNGKAVFIPLKNANSPTQPSITCEADAAVLDDDMEPTFTDQEPSGAKIHFIAGENFQILDRDATDNDGALIQVPATIQGDEPVLSVGIWLRVLGRPLTCLDIAAFAEDTDQGLFFFAGSVDLNRRAGKSTWVRMNDLFDVFFCQVDPDTSMCTEGTIEELSVFNNVFEDYFWNILNDGTRLVQVRLYPLGAAH